VNVNNYFTANSKSNKLINWTHLNEKVIPRLGLKKLKDSLIKKLIESKQGVIEKVLFELREKMAAQNPRIMDDPTSFRKSSPASAAPSKKNGRKLLHRLTTPLPPFSKVELELEMQAIRKGKNLVIGDCKKDTDEYNIKVCFISIDPTTILNGDSVYVGNPDAETTSSDSVTIKKDGEGEGESGEAQQEKTLQAFDASWCSYPLSNDTVEQVPYVDTEGLL